MAYDSKRTGKFFEGEGGSETLDNHSHENQGNDHQTKWSRIYNNVDL